jgi:hypothetical protein
VTNALRDLTGENFGTDRNAWQQWWQEQKEAEEEVEVAWGEAVNGLQLGLAYDGEERVYRPGEVVKFKVYVRNSGEEQRVIQLFSYSAPYYSRPAVRDLKGKPVILTNVIHRGPDEGLRQDLPLPLEPGDTEMLVRVELPNEPADEFERLVELKPGEYRVTHGMELAVTSSKGWRERLEPPWSVKLTSGELKLTVEELELRFGPAVERKVRRLTSWTCVDFDTNRLLSEPVGLRDKPEELRAWCRENGIDLTGCDFDKERASLSRQSTEPAGVDLAVKAVDSQEWNSSASEVVRKASGLGAADMKFGAEPQTFIFKTREGGVGLLQTLGFTKHQGVRFRYKMVERPRPAHEQPTRPEEALWSEAVDGLRLRTWVEGRQLEIGEPMKLHFEFQNVSEKPVRILKDVTISRCFNARWTTSDGRSDTYSIEHHRGKWDVKPEETVVIPAGGNYRTAWTMRGGDTMNFAPGPVSMEYWYNSPANINAEVAEFFWSGVIKGHVGFNAVVPKAESLQRRIDQSLENLRKLWKAYAAYKSKHGTWPDSRNFLRGTENEGLAFCQITNRNYGYNKNPAPGEPMLRSAIWVRDGKVERLEADTSGNIQLRRLPDKYRGDAIELWQGANQEVSAGVPGFE